MAHCKKNKINKTHQNIHRQLFHTILQEVMVIKGTSGNPCLQGTDGFQVWHISSGRKVTSNLEHPLSRS